MGVVKREESQRCGVPSCGTLRQSCLGGRGFQQLGYGDPCHEERPGGGLETFCKSRSGKLSVPIVDGVWQNDPEKEECIANPLGTVNNVKRVKY